MRVFLPPLNVHLLRVRCDMERLLDAETREFFGGNATCEWSTGSQEAVVRFREDEPLAWSSAPSITLAGG